jgi:Gamma-glutamyl cyclotransferase, AIG2-like
MTVFFYGLFMDEALLRAEGAHPANVRQARLDGYALRIGARATLVREEGARCYGMLMELSPADLDLLYAQLPDYRPSEVIVSAGGERIAALCYTLPEPSGARNAEYARKLRALAERLALPEDYVNEI